MFILLLERWESFCCLLTETTRLEMNPQCNTVVVERKIVVEAQASEIKCKNTQKKLGNEWQKVESKAKKTL
jgi:hypothetical protein